MVPNVPNICEPNPVRFWNEKPAIRMKKSSSPHGKKEIVFSAGQTSDVLTPMRRCVLFIYDISRFSLENIKIIARSVCQSQQTNAAFSTTAQPQVKGTNATLESTTGKEGNTKAPRLNTTSNISTFNDDDEWNNIPTGRRPLPDQRRTPTCPNSTNRHSHLRFFARLTYKAVRTTIFHCLKHKNSTDTGSRATDFLEEATDYER